MSCDRKINNKINHIHEKAIRIASKDTTSEFEILLHNNKKISVHMKNLQFLMIEIYKTKSNLNPSFMKEIYIEKNTTYQLRNEY